ncbi:MAG: hypothetical protein ACOCRX_10025 [Candidatus Woesearchaeota archaeon]
METYLFNLGNNKSETNNFEAYKNKEASIMEMREDGAITIISFMPSLTDSEIKNLDNSKINFRVIEKEGMLVTYARYKHSPFIIELPFLPDLYNDNRVENFIKEKPVEIITIDSKSMETKSYRIITFPYKLGETLKKSWENNYSKYPQLLVHIREYDILDLWNIGTYVGSGHNY